MEVIGHVPPTASETAEVRQAEAELRLARAQVDLARAQARPDFGFAAEQAREENNRILMGGGHITLPLFNRGRPEIRAAQERERGAEAQLEVVRRQAEANRRAAMAELDRRRAAVTILQDAALPLLVDNERLIARSYEAGEIDLAELLTLRRQTNTIRMSAIARLQEAVRAWIDFVRATGGAPFVFGETQP
jgi:outer membrane protein TolC